MRMKSTLQHDEDIGMGLRASLHNHSGSACITVVGIRTMNACARAYFECFPQHWTVQDLHVAVRERCVPLRTFRPRPNPPWL